MKNILTIGVVIVLVVGLLALGIRWFLSDPNHFFLGIHMPAAVSGDVVHYGGSMLILTAPGTSDDDIAITEDPKYREAFEAFVLNGDETLLSQLEEEPTVHSVYYHEDATQHALPEGTSATYGIELRIDQKATDFIFLARTNNPAGWYVVQDGTLPPHVSDPRREIQEQLPFYNLDGETNEQFGYLGVRLEAVSFVNEHHAAKPRYER